MSVTGLVLLVLFVLSRVPESLQRFLYVASGLFIIQSTCRLP